jgi:uncharacterized membrane protein HdeD (DUF308 family)
MPRPPWRATTSRCRQVGRAGRARVGYGSVLFIRPDIGALSLATVFGLFSIFYGISALILSFQAREVDSAAHRLVDSTA